MKNIFAETLIVLTCVSFGYADTLNQTQCPPAETIKPCLCKNRQLFCLSFSTQEDFANVFTNSKGYKYDEVFLESAVLLYLTQDVFDQVEIKTLQVVSSTLILLFNSPPGFLNQLENFHLEDVKIYKLNWDHFKALSSLKTLEFYDMPIQRFSEDFSKNLPGTLQFLRFQKTRTKVIKSGSFNNLPNLKELAIESSELHYLTRDMFPMPFNVMSLSFRNNMIEVISDKLFFEMPNLKTLDLRNNMLKMLPESAFDSNLESLNRISLDENPLICECNMEWLVRRGPKYRSGVCIAPSQMKGKDINELLLDDFDC